jgi:glucoamylase
MTSESIAPGWPGIPPTWTSSAKTGLGTALNPASHVWFTISHGIFNEIYYPRVDTACTRDLGLIVTNGSDFFSEEKRHTDSEVSYLAKGVPAYKLVNTCKQGRYRIEKEIIADPQRDVVLQRTRFFPELGSLEDYHLYALLTPHLGNRGSNNTGWVGNYKGVPMLFAERDGYALALASSVPWSGMSVGFAGKSDGWQDLKQHKQLTWHYTRAQNGNIALTGEIDLSAKDGEFVLALGFGMTQEEAGHRALNSLYNGFDHNCQNYIKEWQSWQEKMTPLGEENSDDRRLFQVSTMVLSIHEAKRFAGGMIASLSIPWGFAKGDDDLGGYHLVWPRDLVETAGGLLAAGAKEDTQRVINYLQVIQEADGHWSQNTWLDGRPYWSGIQMDETAFPILLVDLARREEALDGDGSARYWPMVRRAASFLVQNGPVTQEDRWEEDPGYSPFTLAVEVAALLAAADLAEQNQEPLAASYLRETADVWNENIERWTYVAGTDLAKRVGVEGYYVRIAPPEEAEASSPTSGFVPIKNRPVGESSEPAAYIVSPDALSLVRFGLRAPDDPRIIDTVKVIDSLLKVETPRGISWHRYNEDGYGEHKDGSPFDGTGIGRAWPLLTGERAHYELAAGKRDKAKKMLGYLIAFANEGGLIPEQIWDSEDIPERELFCGRPSGSAMPLVWAHAESIKLLRSLNQGKVFDMPPQTVERYVNKDNRSPFSIWRFNHKSQTMPSGKTLRLEVLAPAKVHWTSDNWKTIHDQETNNTQIGVYTADLPTNELRSGNTIRFTFYWPEANHWEGSDFEIKVN